MTTLTKNQNATILIAIVLGFLQSLTWIILSLICIGLYLGKEAPATKVESYGAYLNSILYVLFFYDDREQIPKQLITPTVFFAFMWIYLIFNTLWLASCISLFIAVFKTEERIARNLRYWAIAAGVNYLLDIIFTTGLGKESQNLCGSMPFDYIDAMLASTICYNAVYVAMVIAGKGFLLLIVNAVYINSTALMAKSL